MESTWLPSIFAQEPLGSSQETAVLSAVLVLQRRGALAFLLPTWALHPSARETPIIWAYVVGSWPARLRR